MKVLFLHTSRLELIITGAACLLIIIVGIWILPRKLNQKYYVEKWKKLQVYCRDKATWSKALTEADKLLNRALKKRKYKGKNMGEKMVKAQNTFSDNDSLWYAHSLYKKIVEKKARRLKQSEVKDALVGYRQALRDLGALPGDERKD